MTTADVLSCCVCSAGGADAAAAARAAHRSTSTTSPPAAGSIVVGSDADLAAVLTRLLRAERLDIEVGPRAAAVAGRARRAAPAPAHPGAADPRRDRDVIAGAAYWLPPDEDAASSRRGGGRRHDAVRRRGDRGADRADGDACPACGRACCRGRHAAAALGDRPRRAARHRRGAGGARRRAGAAAGPPVDVLSAHQGWLLPSRLNGSRRDGEHPSAAPIGAAQPGLPGDRRAHRRRRRAGVAGRATPTRRWPTSACSSS